ncbi:ABC transporter substrate-binding protein [Campylobacter sp. faydin G-24]|uniref:ABC transporter substrate-binding protein n=1 Tax=Campylobacter anatolicus TaxID=2829105 RepID=A0ABS5HK10_9BACT|nr:helical backbone metal receptor [Campylobacter anatolicus]MBR8464605.1 ABC transporter substrate-binding protein [Campylobacter anatolicus]
MRKFLSVLTLCLCFVSCFANESKKRLVILDPAVVEIVYKLEAEDQIVAISTLSMSKIWPEDKTVLLDDVGTYTNPNFEKIVSLKPDLVITSFHSMGVNEGLKKFNLPILTLRADSVDDIYSNITQVGKITGKESKATELIANIKSKFKSFEGSPLYGKKVIVMFSSTPITAFSDKTLAGDIFAKLGLKNLVSSTQGATPIISPEFILSNNPDFIIIVGGMGGSDTFLKDNPVLSKTNAAKNGKILNIPSSVLLRGTPRIDEGVNMIYAELTK